MVQDRSWGPSVLGVLGVEIRALPISRNSRGLGSSRPRTLNWAIDRKGNIQGSE